jgi:hypothetical protein
MLRRALREQIKRVSDGLDPMNMKWMSSLTEKYRAQRVEHDPVARRGNLCIRERRCLGELKGRRGKLPAALTNDNAPIDRRSGIEARRQTGQMMEFNRALIIGARARRMS